MFYYDPIEEVGSYTLNTYGTYVDANGDLVVTGRYHDFPASQFGFGTWNESSDALGWFMFQQLPSSGGAATIEGFYPQAALTPCV